MVNRWGRAFAFSAVSLLLAESAGCVQLDTRMVLHEDGTATVTERLRLSRRLLDLQGAGETGFAGSPSSADLERFLEKEAVLARMAQMGSGVQLVHHEVRDAAGASRESVAVFKVSEVNGFRYVSPWLAYLDFPQNNVLECRMEPIYKSRPYAGGLAGEMSVYFKLEKTPKGEARLPEGALPPEGPSPLDQQVHRDLAPVFRDMLSDFLVRFVFESYCPVGSGLGVRGRRSRSHAIDLIHVTDHDLDKWGGPFLENEEVMLDLVRMEFGSGDIVEHVRDYAANGTLPVFTPFGSRHMWWTGGNNITFKPSRPLFDKYFAGKKLDLSAWAPSPPEKHVFAVFEEVGWQKSDKVGSGSEATSDH